MATRTAPALFSLFSPEARSAPDTALSPDRQLHPGRHRPRASVASAGDTAAAALRAPAAPPATALRRDAGVRSPIIAARAGDGGLGAPLLDSMYRLRAQVFQQRLGWDVRVENGREHDWFDLIGPYYLVAHDGAQNALGCCRLLPSVGPNMLRDVFPALLDGAPAPAAESIWEISRFAIDPQCAGDGYGFGPLAGGLLGRMIHVADRLAGTEVIGVTTVAVERLLLHMGLEVRRLGKPRRIGRVMSLAFSIPIHAANLEVAGIHDPQAVRAA